MREDCLGCRALMYANRCDLGYDNKLIEYYLKDGKFAGYKPKPTERCPKPRTWNELQEATPKIKLSHSIGKEER